MNITTDNISLSNSANFDSVCTFFNVDVSINTSVVSNQHIFTLSLFDSNEIRIALGNAPMNCFVNSTTTFVMVPPDFVPNISSQTVYPLDPLPDVTSPSINNVVVDLRTGDILLQFSEIILPNSINISLLSLSSESSPNPSSSLPLSNIVNSMSFMEATDAYKLTIEVSDLPLVGQFCPGSTCYLHLGVGIIAQDVFANGLFSPTASVQSASLIGYSPFFFTGTFVSTPISPTQANITIVPPLERASEVIGYLVYIFLNQVSYYDESCDYPLAYEFQRKLNSTPFYFDDPINNLPACVNTTLYSCYPTQELNIVVSLTPGFTSRRALITQFLNIQFNVSVVDSPSGIYMNLLGLQVRAPVIESRRKRNTGSPIPIFNRVVVEWQVDPSFCDTHQLTLYYGSQTTNIHQYINLDRNTTCGTQYAFIYLTRDPSFIIPDIRIKPSSSQDIVSPNSCIDLRLPISFVSALSFPFVIDRPVISRVSEVAGTNNVDVEWLAYSPNGPFVIDFYNIFIFPIYSLNYNGASCSEVNSQTTINDFTFSPTEYYQYGINPPQDDFNFACPPTPGLTLPYSCYSVTAQNTMLTFPNEYTYARGIIVEAVTRQQDTNQIEKFRSYPVNYTSYRMNLGRAGTNYQQFTWNSFLCHSLSSFVFISSSFVSNGVSFGNSFAHVCRNGLGFDFQLTEFRTYNAISNYFTDVETTNGMLCLLAYESNQLPFSSIFTERLIDVVELRYLNYGTISATIQVDFSFSNSVNLFTLPFRTRSVRLFGTPNTGQLCPSASSFIPFFSSPSITNRTISDMNNLPCVNTSNYFCVFASSAIGVTLSIIPGFDFIIRALDLNSANEYETSPAAGSTFQTFRSLSQVHDELYTNTSLSSANSIRVEWSVDFYCAPNSYIIFHYFQGSLGRRRRGEGGTFRSLPLPCATGSYVLENLDYDTQYIIEGEVLFNSTLDFFPSCPTFVILSSSSLRTSTILRDIQFLDFSNIRVSWNAISNVTSYTIIALPNQFTGFNQSIGDTFGPMIHNQYIQNIPTPNILLFEMCLSSSQNITCSKVSTSELSAVIPTIPGFSYRFALAYDNDQSIVFLEGSYDPSTLVANEIAVSGFNNFYSYTYNQSICPPSARVVFYYDEMNVVTFPVSPCNISQGRVDLSDDFDQLPTSRILFLFPFTPFSSPGLNLTSPTSVGVFVQGSLTFLPVSASPMITGVTPPSAITSSTYQATWTPSPPIPLSQQFESYFLYALPRSTGLFTFTNTDCANNVGGIPNSIVGPIIRNPLIDICPPPNNQFYFCGEFSTLLTGQLPALTLLSYEFQVEASYSGGLRAFNYTTSVDAAQNLSSLELTYLTTPISIIISWNSQVSYCSGSTLDFSTNPSGNMGEELLLQSMPVSVACSDGTFTVQSLLPLTTYLIEYTLRFNVSDLLQGVEKCVYSATTVAFIPLPTTASFCTPINPCGTTVGQCSEGFSNSTYHCDCIQGYRFDGITCVDIDECALVPTLCTNAACLNNIGSFTCTCFVGYAIINGTTCQDINECEITSNCVNGICTNLLPPSNYDCACNSDFEGATCTIPVAAPTCPSVTEPNNLGNNITFPVTEIGNIAIVSCSLLRPDLFGNITRQCGESGEWGPFDLANCQRLIFVSIQATISMIEVQVLTTEESEMLSDVLVMATSPSNGPLFPREVTISAQAVSAITQSLANISRDAVALKASLDNVQDNVVATASNILREENSPAFEAVSAQEAEVQITNLIEAIEQVGILIGSVVEENQTILIEISQPTVALIVTVVRDVTEPLVLGSNLSMPAGENASALEAARTTVSIPASVIQNNGESVAVSVSLFSTVQLLLRNVRVNTTELRPNIVNDTLGSSLASINLFTGTRNRITQLIDPINITFALLNTTPIMDNEIFRCVSSRILSQGYNFDYVTLSNPDDVPPGPVVCTATHLTHFGVLVSVTSQDLSAAETLALEVLTYVTCAASIICLFLSIVAYSVLWFKTRKQQESLFKKDATILHLNFAIALLLALIFFLSSSGGFGNDGWCTTIIILQYYFWLSVFSSSLSIGIYLLIKIFAWSSQRRLWHYLVLLTWALPLPLIIITPSITREYIINRQEMFCWFSKEPLFANLSFIIPMLVVTSTNLVVLVITAAVLYRLSRNNMGMVSQMRGTLIASFILSPILGIPWLFSIASSTPTSAVTFLFTILLGLQGVLFFFLYPLRTPEIIDYFFKCKSTRSDVGTKSSHSGTHPTQATPTAIKFRVKRHEATNTASNSTQFEKLKQDPDSLQVSPAKEIPLEEIKRDSISKEYPPEPDKSENLHQNEAFKGDAEAHL